MTGKLAGVGKKPKQPPVPWTPNPAEHDYPAAESFLRVMARPDLLTGCRQSSSQAPTVHQHAKDVLRAAGLPLLAIDDPETARDLKKRPTGVALSPVLLVGGDIGTGRARQIVDGYHRVCASYHVDEDTDIPRRPIRLPADTV